MATAVAPSRKKGVRAENPGLGPRSVDVPDVGRRDPRRRRGRRPLARSSGAPSCVRARRPTSLEIPHHVVAAPRTPRDEARRALGLPLDRPVAVDARRRDARQADRQDPRGSRGAASGAPAVPLRRAAPSARTTRFTSSSRAMVSSATSRSAGISRTRTSGGRRRRRTSPSIFGIRRWGRRRARSAAWRASASRSSCQRHRLVPRAAGRVRIEDPGRRRGGSSSRGRDGGARLRA